MTYHKELLVEYLASEILPSLGINLSAPRLGGVNVKEHRLTVM